MKVRVNLWPNLLGAGAAGAIVVAFCFLLLWHDPLVFWNDDYELSILPVFADVARSWNEGHWPLLSPYSWVCSNLAGEFQYGTFSVFVNAAVVLIWKFPLTFPQQAATLSITHLFFLAAGAFLLARDRKFSNALSIFVAFVAALNGWIICWGATDWFGALGAFTWLPWSWWGLERALDRQRSRWRFLWPAPFVYLLVTGGFPYTVVMLAVLIAWLACRAVASREGGSILPMLIGVVLGFGFSAPAWMAIFDYVHGSAREVQPDSAHWQWIVPWSSLPALILPSWTVKWMDFSNRMIPHTATELTCGLVPIPALIAGFIWRGRVLVKKLRWDLLLLLLVLLLAMLPTVGLFRWSFRWLPFFHLILALCAAEVLHLRPGLAVGAATFLLLVVLTIAMSILGTYCASGPPLAWIYLELAALWAVLEMFVRNVTLRVWAPAFFAFCAFLATYFCISPNCGVPKYNLSQELNEPAPLDPQRLYLSVYPPPELAYRLETKPGPLGRIVRPGSTPMWAGLRFVNGYSPILPAGIAREFKTAIHGEVDWAVAKNLLEQQAGPDGLLKQIGIDGIVVAVESGLEPQPQSEWNLSVVTNEGRVFYRKGAAFPTVRSVRAIQSRPNEEFVPATISDIRDTRNRVEADVNVPPGDRSALLTFSRPYLRGYQAYLEGKKLFVDGHRGLFPVVQLPAGAKGRLVLVYRPTWLIFGSGLSVVSALIFLGALFAATRWQKQSFAVP